jgi:hypothetical protein
MKFNKIDSDIKVKFVDGAKRNFVALVVELALREDNEHSGTGMGGNNFQLLTLFNMKHKLSSKHSSQSITIDDGILLWNAKWLANSSMKIIRNKLNNIFPNIIEDNKYIALALQSVSRSNHLHSSLEMYKEHFPKLIDCLKGKVYRYDSSLSNIDNLIQASIMCQELAVCLDNGDLTKIVTIGTALYDFPADIILYTVRKYIQLDRLVKFNLDEDPIFVKVLEKVNKLLD